MSAMRGHTADSMATVAALSTGAGFHTVPDMAAALRAQRSTTQEDVDATESARDAERGEYVAHHGAHHFNSESRH